MSLLSFLKYSAAEKGFVEVIQSWLISACYAAQEKPDISAIKKLSYALLDKCITEAEQKKLRNVDNLGDIMVSDKEFMSNRLLEGLTEADVKEAWNTGYVWIRLQEEASNACNSPIYQYLVEGEGLSPEKAVKGLRCSMPFFGDPVTSHADYQGDDADIYLEFRRRFDQWREKYTPEQIISMAKEFSTYNAMIRYYIRKGEL